MGSFLKTGKWKGRKSQHRNNVCETMKDRRRAASERTGIHNSNLQTSKSHTEKIKEKNEQKRNKYNKHISKPQPFSLNPTEVRVENTRERFAQSILSVALPKPSISLSDYRQRHSSHA